MQPLVFTAGIYRLIDWALEEDIGSGDITTDYLVAPEADGQGRIIAKESLTLAGLDVARQVFAGLYPETVFLAAYSDGDTVDQGTVVATINARMTALLRGERTALNFLQRLSGIATHVRSFMRYLENSRVRLVDTRKTTPGWRVLEKYAVRIGGAGNHRMGLYDGVLIKDNHIVAAGGIANAVTRLRSQVSHLTKIEVETATQQEVQEAIDSGADVIMLDNMDITAIKAAVALIDGRALVEVSGGVTQNDLQALVETGVDLISSGALTHSARAVDLSMKIKAV